VALAALIDRRLQAAGVATRFVVPIMGAPSFYAEGLPAGDVTLHLHAAGFSHSPPFIAVGPCRVWAAPPVAMVAPVLGEAMTEALRSLDVPVQPCTTAARPADAHLLVWVEGGPPPIIPHRQQPTFLSGPGVVPPPAPPPGAPPAQGPGAPPPPGALQALGDCGPIRPNMPADPSIAAPTEVQVIHVADERRIGITWRDEADNETCFGVVQTANAPPQLVAAGSAPVIIIALADANGATTLARPGHTCFRVFAGNQTGRSALSEEACVEVPAPPVPPPPPPGDEIPDWLTRFRGRATLFTGEPAAGLVLEAYIGEGIQTTLCGRTSVQADGVYTLDVFGAAVLPGCGRVGDTVRFSLGPGNDVTLGALPFSVAGLNTGPYGTVRPGEIVELDLRIVVPPRQPPRVPTPAPTPSAP
jgi:hypothetical protein